MSAWFGRAWPDPRTPAPVCADPAGQVATPVGQRCLWCEEEVVDGDRGVLIPCAEMHDGRVVGLIRPAHAECQLRMVLGGPAHLLGTCTCCAMAAEGVVPATDPDLGMTSRDAALWVWNWVDEHGTVAP